MKYHIVAFFMGFLLDLLLGDPYWLPHPIRWIGALITQLEKWLLSGNKKCEVVRGVVLAVTVLTVTTAGAFLCLETAYYIHPCLGFLVESIMTYQILAAKCLKDESMKVHKCLKNGNLGEARMAVSMIVGRDVMDLDEEGVAKAAIETVAENTSDGVIAPMLYAALGGPVLGFFYKAVNTMDSMVGYQNDKYLYFGRAAAKLDDFMNFIPARVSACIMILAAFCGGRDYSGKRAYYIYKRDRKKHKSPNSGQTEAACAGALGIQLSGNASYFGKLVEKPYIGTAFRKIEYEDIKRANDLMYRTAWMAEAGCLLLMAVFHTLC